MSRVERKSKKKSNNTFFRILFLFCMFLNLAFCMFLIEKGANDYLGKESKSIESRINDLLVFSKNSFNVGKEVFYQTIDHIKKSYM